MAASNKQQPYAVLPDDVWFQIAKYIAPEDVKRFAMICVQSANITNSRAFWFHIHSQYCQHEQSYIERFWKLPEHLQIEHLQHCDKDELKRRVIQVLYRRYPYFALRLGKRHSLDTLVGRIYLTSWSGDYSENFLFWYLMFKLKFPLNDTKPRVSPFQMKRLDCPYKHKRCECAQNHDGIRGLHIRCSSLNTYFPEDLMLDDRNPYELIGIREVSVSGSTIDKLQLDFVSSSGVRRFIHATFSNVYEYSVIPWWHPTFKVFE